MDDAKVMSILDEMDWRDDLNDREVPRDSSHELDTSDEENEAGEEREEDIDEILAEVAKLKAERDDCDSVTGIAETSLLSATEFRDWNRNMAKMDTAKIDEEIARERAQNSAEDIQ